MTLDPHHAAVWIKDQAYNTSGTIESGHDGRRMSQRSGCLVYLAA